ncbi:MAG: hypothetical protein RSC25_02010 [Christensenella sp.]
MRIAPFGMRRAHNRSGSRKGCGEVMRVDVVLVRTAGAAVVAARLGGRIISAPTEDEGFAVDKCASGG